MLKTCPLSNPRRAASWLVGCIVVAVLAMITWPRPAAAWGLGSLVEHAATYTAGRVASHEIERSFDHREDGYEHRDTGYERRDAGDPQGQGGAYHAWAPAASSRGAGSAPGAQDTRYGDALYIEPQAGAAPVVGVIAAARQAVDLNVYYLSSKPVLQALHAAAARGVQVRVILDQKPYGIRNDLVVREANAVLAAGASLHWAPMRFERSAFDHAKYVCNESTCLIGTANFDPSAFTRNREYLVVTSTTRVVDAARAVFAADWADQHAPAWVRKTLVLSPGSTPALLWAIQQSGPVSIETEELGNAQDILRALAAKGAQVRLILPDSVSAANRRNAQALAEQGVQVRFMPRRTAYMHAKIITGAGGAFLGSQNFSTTSLEQNREMGLLLGPAQAAQLQRQFDVDWVQAQPQPLG